MPSAQQVVRKQDVKFLILVVLALLAIFFIALYHLTRESLAYDEGWSMWAVQPASTDEMIARVAADVHPPLYFLLLDGWVALAGESDLAARFLSVTAALLGLAATYAVGRALFDRWTALLSMLLLGTTSFFVYYAREARMYSLLLALASVSMWAYWRWQQAPSRARTIIHGLSIATLFYTHYYGLLIIASQVIHSLLVAPKRMGRWLWSGGLALLLIAPWLPVWIDQVRAHPNGPLAQPTPTNAATVTWLLLLVTSGLSFWIAAPYALGRALPRARQQRSAMLLLVVWLLLTPLVVLTANAYLAPLYQPRYLIGSLPALMLLIAYGLRHVFWKPLALGLAIGLVSVHLLAYPTFWPDRPHWKESLQNLIAARHPGEPTLALLAPQSIEAYYARQLGLQDARTIELAGRSLTPTDWGPVVSALDTAPSVWVVLPTNVGATWDIVAQLNRDRRVGYRDSVVNVIFYRFDRGAPIDRTFRFGDKVQLAAAQTDRSEAQPGNTVCVTLTLSTIGALGQEYSAGLHLVNEANALIAQQDSGLAASSISQPFTARRCVEIPAATSPGIYYLYWVIYNWTNGEQLPVLEGDNPGVFWGNVYVVGHLMIARSP